MYMHASDTDIAALAFFARDIRASVLDMLVAAGSGHLGGSLGAADICATLYGHVLRHNPNNPAWEERDRLVLSHGHIAPARYAAMALAGYFDVEELASLRAFGSRLQGHPEHTHLPGLETTSGPLGEGLGQAVGMALAARMDNSDHTIYPLLSDGEQQCGATWEAVLAAAHYTLGNIIATLDRNGLQIGGSTEDIMRLSSLREKYEAFGWHVLVVDGHDIPMLIDAYATAQQEKERPSIIIAHTVMGKGVKEIEGKHEWHGKAPTQEQAEKWKEALQVIEYA
jgi:transketolase